MKAFAGRIIVAAVCASVSVRAVFLLHGRPAMGVDDATVAVGALVERLGLPTRLSEVGVTDDDLDAVARLSQGNGNVRANPRPVSEEDARAILDSVF